MTALTTCQRDPMSSHSLYSVAAPDLEQLPPHLAADWRVIVDLRCPGCDAELTNGNPLKVSGVRLVCCPECGIAWAAESRPTGNYGYVLHTAIPDSIWLRIHGDPWLLRYALWGTGE